jgi:large subunit ribosomal protein L19
MTNQLLRSSKVVTDQLKDTNPEFKTGTVIEVHYKIKEGVKERIQIFSGVVISRHGGKGLDATFTVLKNSTAGIKVYRTFPLHSPSIDKIVVASAVQRAKQSKLYHLGKLKDPIKSLRVRTVKPVKA